MLRQRRPPRPEEGRAPERGQEVQGVWWWWERPGAWASGWGRQGGMAQWGMAG